MGARCDHTEAALDRYHTPGPGSYDTRAAAAKLYAGPSAPFTTANTGDARALSKREAEQQSMPGPGSYNPRAPTLPKGASSMVGDMGKSARWIVTKGRELNAEEQAAEEKLMQQAQPSTFMTPGFSLGGRSRVDFEEKEAASGPGPAAYSTAAHLGVGAGPRSARHGKGAKKGFGNAPRLVSPKCLTADAEYAPARSTLSGRGGGWSRQEAFPQKKPSVGPGPGAYRPMLLKGATNAASWEHSAPRSAKHNNPFGEGDGPGPAAHNTMASWTQATQRSTPQAVLSRCAPARPDLPIAANWC